MFLEGDEHAVLLLQLLCGRVRVRGELLRVDTRLFAELDEEPHVAPVVCRGGGRGRAGDELFLLRL